MYKKAIPIGKDDFQKLVEEDCYYVDKTKIIEELITKRCEVILFPRPRRFGKTLTMSMLENFFNIEKKEENKNLFKELYISKTEAYKQLNTYPTIFISFKELKQDIYEDVYEMYKELMVNLYTEKKYVYDSLDEDEKDFFSLIKSRKGSVVQYKLALSNLMGYLAKYYNKKVILLIDEYDAPIQQGYLEGYFKEIVSLIRTVFSSCLNGNVNLKMGVITGVLRVGKESIFSDLNNLDVHGIYGSNFGEYFGFTEEETKELLNYYDLDLTKEVKDMYDGYNFNGVEIYNSWSILNYASRKTLNTYWINTSGYNLAKEMISNGKKDTREVIENMVQGESYEFTYNERLTYQDFDNYGDRDIVLNLLFSLGYLTIDKTIDIDKAYLKIPNNEVKELIFRSMPKTVIENKTSLTSIVKKAIDTFDMDKLEKILNDKLLDILYYDYEEKHIRMYMGGIFGECIDNNNNNNYIVKSNKRTIFGREDVMIEKVDKSFGYIFEFKEVKDIEEMEDTAANALAQIDDREYYKELVLDKVKDIHKIAIVFNGKKCIVR